MKRFIILLFLPACCMAQKPVEDLSTMLTTTKKIMLDLLIPMRTNTVKDDIIEIKIDSNLVAFNAKFGTRDKQGVMMRGDEYATRYYFHPLLKLSPLLYAVFCKRKDTSDIAYLKAETIIIHELTHYLQVTWDENVYSDEWDIQFDIPAEFEAYSVSSYYFISQYNNKLLMDIMLPHERLRKKEELLINTWAKELYPWRSPPFIAH